MRKGGVHRREAILIVNLERVGNMGEHGCEGEPRRNALIETVADRGDRMLDGPAGMKAAYHAGRLRRLDGNDLSRGGSGLQAQRRARSETRRTRRSENVMCLGQGPADLQSQGPRTCDDVRTFAVIDECDLMALREGFGDQLGVVEIRAPDMQPRSQVLNCRPLGLRATLGKKDVGASSKQARGIGDRLAVIAG